MVAPNDDINLAMVAAVVGGFYASPVVEQTDATMDDFAAPPDGWVSPAASVIPANAGLDEPSTYYRSLWWEYKPLASGTAVFDTALSPGAPGSNLNDTVLQVYQWRPNDFTRKAVAVAIGTATEHVGYRDRVTAAVVAGETYYVQVMHYSSSGVLPGVVLSIAGPDSVIEFEVIQTGATLDTVTVEWPAAIVGSSVDGFRVTADGSDIDAGQVDEYTVTGLDAGTDYPVTVTAYVDTTVSTNQVPTAVTESSIGGGDPGSNAFDGNAGTRWTSNATSSGWVRAQYATAKTIGSYVITSRNDILALNPTAWTLEGSPDGATWTVVDTRAGVSWPVPDVKTYTVASPGSFLYYRLNVSANGGHSHLSFAELSLRVDVTTRTYHYSDTVTASTSPGDPPPAPGAPAPGVASHTVRDALELDPVPVPGVPHFFTWQEFGSEGWAHHGARSDGLIGYTITHGRREPLGRPAPAIVTVSMLVPIDAPAPEIGERFRLTIAAEAADLLGLAPGDRVRCTAKITDTETTPTYLKILPGHGPATLHTITATALLARQQAATLDGREWPTESAGARASRVLDWLGLAGTIDAGGAELAPPTTVGNVGAALTAIMDSTGSQVVDQRDGTVDYHGREHRRGTPVRATLTAAQLLALNFTFRKSVGDVINRATITLADGETHVTVADAVSEDPFTGPGPYPTAIATLLTDEADAAALATLLVSRRARPSYQLPAVTVDLARSIDTATLADVLAVRAADKIQISGMPAGSPWDTLPNVYAEGYTETATAYAWRLSLVVSDPLQTGPALRWMDVPDGVSWADVRDGLAWLDAARTDNPADLL